ncbi:TonB-dependent receptor [Chitinophaga sp. HK235]|uniref:SusC/RagA family TonB-linked outer membrane protein n=1 Tax=Chitinophaga sp. HK235 TaxID=2952571 RepID=UPI001BA7DCBE|nr:TonB-dependent receptor [Chitinophaga sp. HK235]
MLFKQKVKRGMQACGLPAKILLFMKLTLILMIAATLQVTAGAFGQKVTLHRKDASLLEVLKSIRKQTGCSFIGDRQMLQRTQGIDIAIANATTEEAMNACMKGLPLSWSVVGNTIIIREKDTPTPLRSSATDSSIVIRGKVTDSSGLGLPGVSVTLRSDPRKGVQTDAGGNYTFRMPVKDILVFTYIGFDKKEIPVTRSGIVNAVLQPVDSKLNEVAVVAYGTQKKTSMVGSVTTINPKELKGPTSNLTTMLSGRLAGVISYQRSGEPGRDNAEFFIRGITSFGSGKVDPLILIDGMEMGPSDLARIQPDDIAGFSILKDATASSLYGARGANGVILVTTKSGQQGKTRFNVRVENSTSSNTRNFKLADNVTYMKLANEAVITREPLTSRPYLQSKIAHTDDGDDPYLYPNNNWIDNLVKDNTNNQRYNLNLNGGVDRAQYYIGATYNIDNGVLRTIADNNFNSNVKSRNYEIRSNINIKLTPTTDAIVRTSGRFSDYNGPIRGGGEIFRQAMSANPVRFPAYFPASFAPDEKHPLFGNMKAEDGTFYTNPFANAVSGFQQETTSTLIAQLELKQNFNFLTKGLSARLMTYTKRYSFFNMSRKYNPFYYSVSIDPEEGLRGLNLLNETDGTEYLSFSQGDKQITTFTYLEAAVNYDKVIRERHAISGMLITILNNQLTANAGSLIASLPRRNQGISGRFTYAYDDRYLMEFNFGYNGSERFDKNHRFGFFPSIGFGWNVSNEKFFSGLLPVITRLKLRGTYGLVGNDQIGNTFDRFFYLSDVNLNTGYAYSFGENFTESKPGVVINRYENRDITWEKAYKTNLGFELELFKNLRLEADFFQERRSNILMSRSYIPSTMGLNVTPQANVGIAMGRGVDMSLDYKRNFGKNAWAQIRGTFTYATSKILVNEEPKYPEQNKYLSRVGYPIRQMWGLVAERYFVDEHEVMNSPRQNYGGYMAGDIKYKDINGDGQITNLDLLPIGYPTTPEINYGFGFTFGYRAFDISAFFQGSGRSSIFISPGDIAPFITGHYVYPDGGVSPTVDQHGLLQVVADNHWSENNRDLYAFWPRLSVDQRNNNLQTSTWWMRNGAFLRLKTVELGYTLPQRGLKRYGLSQLRVYLNGFNLLMFSQFKLWDVEMGGNGLGYPVQRVFNAGINLGF